MLNFIFRALDLFVPFLTLYLSIIVAGLPDFNEPYLELGIVSGFLMLVLNELRASHFQPSVCRNLSEHLQMAFENWGVVVLSLIVYLYLTESSNLIARRAVVVWLLLLPIIIILLKIICHRVYLKSSKPTILLCVGEDLVLTHLERERIAKSNIKMNYSDSILNVDTINGVDSIIFNYDTSPSIDEIRVLTHLELSGTKLISSNAFYEKYLRKCHVPYDIKSIEFMNDLKRPRKFSLFLKYFIDLFMVSFIFTVTFPIILASVFFIKMQSPGAVLFKQTRVGGMMRNFTVVKFRSMHEHIDINPYTKKDDKRVFPYGLVMRKTRIDELPQFWNILKGDMHLIGPRAEWNILVNNYEKKIPYYHERHLVKPGISGWAQVMYPYGENVEDARQKLMYDLYYIKYWSVWLEIETIIRTINIVIGRKGL